MTIRLPLLRFLLWSKEGFDGVCSSIWRAHRVVNCRTDVYKLDMVDSHLCRQYKAVFCRLRKACVIDLTLLLE